MNYIEKVCVVKEPKSDPLDMKFEVISGDDLLVTQRLEDLIAFLIKKTGAIDSYGTTVSGAKWSKFHEDVKKWVEENYDPNVEI